jgi:hypothetical protein
MKPLYFLEQSEAVDTGHPDVGNDQLERGSSEQSQSLGSIGGFGDIMAR